MKYMDLYRRLRQRVMELPNQTQLPSRRAMMEEYGVSQATADKALALLRSEGLIASRAGAGTFVVHPTHARRKAIRFLLVINDFPSDFSEMVTNQVGNVLREAGHALQTLRYPHLDRIARHLPRSGYDAMLALGPFSAEDRAALARWRDRGRSVVLLDATPQETEFDAVGTDNELGGRLAARHLIGNGHSCLAVLGIQETQPTLGERIRGFCDEAKKLGGHVLQHATSPISPEDNETARARTWLRDAGNVPFTGLFCVNDAVAIGTLKGAWEAGLHVPTKLSIVGYDGLPIGEYLHPGLTTIGQDIRAWTTAALEIAVRRRQDSTDPWQCRLLPPNLVLRGSAATLRESTEG
jgi:DNA-binding LacI/PurR family transcriptional regulator